MNDKYKRNTKESEFLEIKNKNIQAGVIYWI